MARALLVLAALVLPAILPAAAGEEPAVTFEDFSVVTADGTTVHGKLAYPTGVAPRALVVFAHGYGQTVEGAWLGHMAETAGHGAAVVAVNYRDNFGFPVLRGAEDTNAAALAAFERFHASVDRVFLFGVSLGGAVSGIALAEAPDRMQPSEFCTVDGTDPGVCEHVRYARPLYDGWFDVEGVSNLFETYNEARLVGHPAAAAIERETGGTSEEVPQEYARRSPALRADDMRVRWAVLVHAVNDGTVPYDQTVEMAAALEASGVVVDLHTVLRERAGHTEGTTGTGVLAGAAGQDDPSETTGLHLAGHAWEGDRESRVMNRALSTLFAVLDSHCQTLSDVGVWVEDGETHEGVDYTGFGCLA